MWLNLKAQDQDRPDGSDTVIHPVRIVRDVSIITGTILPIDLGVKKKNKSIYVWTGFCF